MKTQTAVVALAFVIASLCRAASPAPLPDSLLACTKLTDATERVSCYDTEIAAITHQSRAPATASPPAPTVAATPPRNAAPVTPAPTPPIVASPASAASIPTPAAPTLPPPAKQFGDEQLPNRARAKPEQKDEALQSSITGLRTIGQKIYLISLANGQVWRQEGSQLPALFRLGNEVRIEKGAFGSYHLSAVALGEKNWVLVTRTQ